MNTTKEEIREILALASCATGILLVCDFAEFQDKAEQLLNRPVMTHEFADKETMSELKELAMEQLVALQE